MSVSSVPAISLPSEGRTPRANLDALSKQRFLNAELLIHLGWWLLALSMFACAPMAVNRAVHNMGGTDFPEYYAAGAYLLEHGTAKPHAMTAYYLPSLDVVWAGMALFPIGVACFIWYTLGCIGWIGLLRAVDRYLLCELPQPARQMAIISAGLLVVPLLLDSLCIGAFHGLMLWWMVAGLGRISRGQRWSGAALLGLAIWIKLLPGLGAVYLLIKRRWREAFAAGCMALVLDLALCLLAYSWQDNWQAHVEWLHRDAAGTAQLLLSEPLRVNEQRVTNQSLPAVLRRTLTHFGYPANDARDLAVLANLNSAQLKGVYYSIIGVLAASLLWYFRRSAARTPPAEQATEIALLVLSTLWFSPIGPSYHPMVILPALALILARHPYQRVGWLAVLLWTAALGLHGVPVARAFGHMLWATFLIGGLLLWPYRTETPAQVAELRD